MCRGACGVSRPLLAYGAPQVEPSRNVKWVSRRMRRIPAAWAPREAAVRRDFGGCERFEDFAPCDDANVHG